jgi:predicted nucleotidyltransferase component of viral defense system
MAPPSAQTLQRLAGETGLQAGTLEKVIRLLDLLSEITADATLRDRVALKGGTALNVFHLALDRLSVDIDLNYVGALDRAAMEAGRPEVEAALTQILTAQGYALRRQPEGHAGGKWIARYGSALGGGATLEVDLNFMMRQPLFGVRRMVSVTLGERPPSEAIVVDIHEVAAGKLVALLDRKAARDLFDARRILEIPNLDWRLIRAAVLAFGASGRRDWREASLDDIGGDPKELRDKLAICLPQGMFRDAGGVKAWIDESVKVCREGLRDLFNRTPGERRFLEALLDRGEVDPDGLDAPEEVRARIAQMPMLAWKAQHVLAHKTAQDRRDTS